MGRRADGMTTKGYCILEIADADAYRVIETLQALMGEANRELMTIERRIQEHKDWFPGDIESMHHLKGERREYQRRQAHLRFLIRAIEGACPR